MPLTEVAVRNAKPKEKPYRLADEKGMYLETHPSGGKYWRLKYRFAGKEKRLALGVYPETSLAEARRRRDYARELIANGADPSEAKKAAKHAQTIAAENSFEAVARRWHQRGNPKKLWLPEYAEKIMRSLEVDVFPQIGARPINEIRPPEALAMLRKVEARGTLETLKRVRQRVRDVFTFAIAEGLRDSENPVSGLEKALKTRQAEHYPALHARQLPEFFIR
ncbi:MAG: integrase arm-type DNA-binding domain-containing protein, partial [Rhodocyclaceae bacterium]